MEDKPTLKEYLEYRNTRYVRTIDGRYYAVVPSRKIITIMIILCLVIFAPMPIIFFSEVPWHMGIAYDLIVVLYIFVFLLPRLIYPFQRFKFLQEGSEEYFKASAKPYPRDTRIIILAMTIVACIVLE